MESFPVKCLDKEDICRDFGSFHYADPCEILHILGFLHFSTATFRPKCIVLVWYSMFDSVCRFDSARSGHRKPSSSVRSLVYTESVHVQFSFPDACVWNWKGVLCLPPPPLLSMCRLAPFRTRTPSWCSWTPKAEASKGRGEAPARHLAPEFTSGWEVTASPSLFSASLQGPAQIPVPAEPTAGVQPLQRRAGTRVRPTATRPFHHSDHKHSRYYYSDATFKIRVTLLKINTLKLSFQKILKYCQKCLHL